MSKKLTVARQKKLVAEAKKKVNARKVEMKAAQWKVDDSALDEGNPFWASLKADLGIDAVSINSARDGEKRIGVVADKSGQVIEIEMNVDDDGNVSGTITRTDT